MDRRLNIAFVWHMHQPIYKDPFTGEYIMPWVLFHGTKDYYDMAAILEEFPGVHQTFNMVPCLIEQIEEYISGKAKDQYRRISAKKASELTRDEKAFILKNFFQANWDRMLRPITRYKELLKKRGVSNTTEDIDSVIRYFNEQDYLDLQVLFNLVWIDPELRRKDRFLDGLGKKGKSFTEEDKAKLLDKQIEILKMIVPKYRELQEKGIIEVSTSPFYHPILPLLCDHDSAKESMPWAKLPQLKFSHPEDAETQIQKGVDHYTRAFGRAPVGMWPSEGSVSMGMAPLLPAAGIKWMATDEEILSNTLRRPIRRDNSGNCYDSFLYRPYSLDTPSGDISVIFRDHVLSDLIGFDYARMGTEAAANDLVGRLAHIYGMLEQPQDHLVSIILDGENAWETYPNDGRDFLVSLYSKLQADSRLRCVTVSEFMNEHSSRDHLDWIYPGSWISHNFKIWIGHEEDNAAWDYISEARDALVRYEKAMRETPDYEKKKADIEMAWENVYIAEGSDWFWWYGEEHSTMSDDQFDNLFRLYIRKIYTLIELEPPLGLDLPISSAEKGVRPVEKPTAFISPTIDGEVSNYFEWLASGRMKRRFFGGAMHKELQETGLIEGISYGFSTEDLFLRFDYLGRFVPYAKEWDFLITFLAPGEARLKATVKGNTVKAALLTKPVDERWTESEDLKTIAAGSVVELSVPLASIGARTGEEIRMFINIDGRDMGVERWPLKGFLVLEVPSEDFEQEDWIV